MATLLVGMRCQPTLRLQCDHSSPTYPLTSTLENPVVGVGGAAKPMNDRVRPCERKVDTRGVVRLGKGTGPVDDVRVIVEGVRVVKVGEGGKRKSV